MGDGLFGLRLLGLAAEQGDQIQRAGLGLLAFELIEVVLAASKSFHQQTGARVAVALLERDVLQCEGSIAAAEVLQRRRYGTDHFAPLTRVEFFGFTDADRKSTRLNSSHVKISYAVFCLKKKKKQI